MILKGIQHPNLITLIGACTKRCILAYEYMPGGTLEDRLLSGKEATFSWFHRVNVAFDVCCALVFLHSTKPVPIVHGDLKPSNVLLDETGCAKLSDFGISRHLYNTTDSGTPSHLTDNPKGSGCYMDPSFTKTKVLTTSADTFAFGIMVLELLTGFGGAGLRKYAADKALSISNFSKERKEKTICKVKVAVPQWNSHDESRSIALEMLDVGLRCSSKERQGRPDLELEVWPVVKGY
jgi:serine/threonine protein kinase